MPLGELCAGGGELSSQQLLGVVRYPVPESEARSDGYPRVCVHPTMTISETLITAATAATTLSRYYTAAPDYIHILPSSTLSASLPVP